jgi:hypothetical protein
MARKEINEEIEALIRYWHGAPHFLIDREIGVKIGFTHYSTWKARKRMGLAPNGGMPKNKGKKYVPSYRPPVLSEYEENGVKVVVYASAIARGYLHQTQVGFSTGLSKLGI